MEKRCQTRVHQLLCDRGLYKVSQRFGMEVFRRSSIFHGLDEILAGNSVRGKTCFEIGSWNGLTAVVLSRYFDRVISVDIVDNPLKYEITEYLGIDSIRFFHIKDNADKAKIAGKYKFDFAYVDGDHAADTQSDWEMVRDCGRVLFHEAWRHQRPVWELLQSLPRGEITMNDDGLALWVKAQRDASNQS